MASLGFVGCAHIHTPAFVRAVKERGLSVAGVWDHDGARAAKNATELGCEARELDALLADSALTAVVICSETRLHSELVSKVVKANKALFVEKPLGMGSQDSFAMAEAIEANSLTFQTGYRMRGEPNVLAIKQLIDSGSLGKITRARVSVCHNGALGGWFDGEWRWMADRAEAGVGGYGDLGTHGIDILMWLLGPVAAATGAISNGTARYPQCDELGEGLLKFESGVIGTLASSWDDHDCPERLMVSGTDGFATILRDRLYVTCPKLELDGKEPFLDLPPAQSAGFDAFLDWLEGKPTSLVSAREAAERDAALEAIYRGAEFQTWMAPIR